MDGGDNFGASVASGIAEDFAGDAGCAPVVCSVWIQAIGDAREFHVDSSAKCLRVTYAPGKFHRMFYRHLTSELWKLFGKKRTYIGFGAFLVAQNVTLLFFRFSRWQQDVARNLEGNGYLVSEYISALTVALIMLLPPVVLLMPLYAALVGGDLVAKEAEDGTLRMILSRPISRFRLLLVKWLAGVVFAVILVTALGATALAFARLWFPWRGMFVGIVPGVFNVLSAGDGFKLYLVSHLFM